MSNEGWVKMSDRKPSDSDFPAWYWKNGRTVHALYWAPSTWDIWTHWMKAELPEPPTEKPTDQTKSKLAELLTQFNQSEIRAHQFIHAVGELIKEGNQ